MSENMYERTNDLIVRKFRSYLFPTILMTMALSLGVVVDSIIVSYFVGNDGFSAVQLCSPVILCYNAFFTLVGVGGSTYGAMLKGKKKDEEANSVFTSSVILLAILSVLFMVLGNVFSEQVVGVLCSRNSSSGANSELVKEYYTTTIWGAPFFVMVSGMIPFIRTDGKPKLASKIIITSNVVNLVLDLILVGVVKVGLFGAALSSVIGYFAGGFIVIVYLRSKDRTFKFTKNIVLGSDTAKICAVGAASALATGLGFCRNLCINRIILGTLGSAGIISYSVCCNCLTLATMFIGGTVQTLLPVVGVLYGEGDNKGISAALKTAVKFAVIACVCIVALFEIFPNVLCKIFSVNDPEIMAMAMRAIRIYAFSLPFYTFTFIMLSFYQTTAKKLLAVIITCCQSFGFVVLIVYLFSKIGDGSNLWFGFVISDVSAAVLVLILSTIYYVAHKGKYKPFILTENCDCGEKYIEMTTHNDKKEAVDVSYKVIDFCKENGIDSFVSQCAGIAAEEMAINIISYGYNKDKLGFIDISVKIIDGVVVLRLRDDGVFFNPAVFKADENSDYSGIETVRKLAKSMEYSRVLGFNTTIIKLENKQQSVD